MSKRLNPFQQRMNEVMEWAGKVAYPRRKHMFTLKGAKNGPEYRMDDVYQRAVAARQLGYTVELVADDNGDLQIMYVEKRPDRIPYNWRYYRND